MIVTQLGEGARKFTLAAYASPRDLLKQTERGDKLRGRRFSTRDSWAGGTYEYFTRGMIGAVADYVKAADKLTTQFGNAALEDYGVTLDANVVQGVLDYSAALAGDPMCMYGATIEEHDRSPIEIYVDPWVSGEVAASAIERRGIVVLALVQALSLFRPVRTYILKGSRHLPARANTVQTLEVPTMPMDLSKASFMLCSPTVNRHGFLSSINAVHGTKKECGSPPLPSGVFRGDGMASWLAERHGVKDYVHMEGMWTNDQKWATDEGAVDWVKAQLAKYVEKINS